MMLAAAKPIRILVFPHIVAAGSELHHLAFKIGDAREQLARAKGILEATGTPILMTLDHQQPAAVS